MAATTTATTAARQTMATATGREHGIRESLVEQAVDFYLGE
ncbi:hypothetical protein [Sinomonas sp.]